LGYELQFLTNSGKWQAVDSGSKEAMDKELKKRADLFHDANRYRIKQIWKLKM
jgi:hypothetical protein